jgi:sterol desaturase/sphingolipid hydroxylase (fatty acid hydroxylase superfamily)
VAVALHTAADHCPVEHAEGGKQGGGVVRHGLAAFRPQLEAALAVALPVLANRRSMVELCGGLPTARLFELCRASLSARGTVLWRFHALHHSDPDVGFYWVAVLALDIPVVVVLSHALAVFAASAVTHGNMRLPECNEANANFDAVLSVWDRLFGTFARLPRAQQDQIVFGVRELQRRDCLKRSAMLPPPGGFPVLELFIDKLGE